MILKTDIRVQLHKIILSFQKLYRQTDRHAKTRLSYHINTVQVQKDRNEDITLIYNLRI